MISIMSTASNNIEFPKWAFRNPKQDQIDGIKQPPEAYIQDDKTVVIKGGANVLRKNKYGELENRSFTETLITEEDYAWLKDDRKFQRAIANGFFTVVTGIIPKKKKEKSMIAKSLEKMDRCAQPTPETMNSSNFEAARRQSSYATDMENQGKSDIRRLAKVRPIKVGVDLSFD
jgi:hypothetical protein